MERAERFVFLGVGLAFDILVPVLWIMLVLTAATAVYRFVRVYRQADPPPRTHATTARTRRRERAIPAPALRDWWTTRRVEGDRTRRRHPSRAPQLPSLSRARRAAGGSPPRVPRRGCDRRSRCPARVASPWPGVAGAVARWPHAGPPRAWPRATSARPRRVAALDTDAARRRRLRLVRPLLARDAAAAGRGARRRGAGALHDRGLRAHRGRARARQGRDPRAAAPRRLGVGRRVDGAPGPRLLAVVERIEPPELLEWFAEQRAAIGIDVVPLGPDVSGACCRRCATTGSCACSATATSKATASRSSSSASARRCPAVRRRSRCAPGRRCCPPRSTFAPAATIRVVRPPIAVERAGRLREDIARITQVLAHELEALIRAAPEQWHLLQPNWPSDRDGKAR